MKELGDRLGEARAYANLGNVKHLQNDLDASLEQNNKSLELMESLENRPGIAQQCEALGDIYLKKEELEKAEGYFTRASRLFDDMKDPASVRQVQDKLVYIMGQPKYLDRRRVEIEETLMKPEVEKNDEQKSFLLEELGNLHFLANDIDKAIEILNQALSLQEKLNNKSCIGSTLGNLGGIYLKKEDWDNAEKSYSRAIQVKEEINETEGYVIW